MAKPTITTRAGKGSALTWTEGDANLNNLRDATVAIKAGSAGTSVVSDLNGEITLVAGTNITLTGDNTAKTITVAASGGGLTDVVNDTTPQLGGSLDVNGNSIVSTSNGNINISPNGSGNISLAPTTGKIILGALDFPTGMGTNGQVLTTNGSSAMSWSTPSSGGLTDVVNDTTPQLGGDLDVQDYKLTSTGATGDITLKTKTVGNIINLDANNLYLGSPTTGTSMFITTANNKDLTVETYGGAALILRRGANGHVELSPAGASGKVYLGSNAFPSSLGTSGQVLSTDGAGVLSWSTPSSGGLTDVVNDTSPSLGGNLDIGSYNIFTTAGDVVLSSASGNGFYAQGDWLGMGKAARTSPIDIYTVGSQSLNFYTDNGSYGTQITLTKGANGNIVITPPGTGSIVLDGQNWPQADGTANQVLKTNGAGQLSWTTISAGATNLDGLSDVVITAAAAGEVLYYNGTNWVDTALSGLTAGNVSGTVALANGGTGQTTAPAANAALMGFTTTATAAGTTTLTNTSSAYQLFTGSSTQTVVLPSTATLATGWFFHIVNNSTGSLTLNTSTGTNLGTIIAGVTAMVSCISVAGNTAAAWELGFTDFSTLTGTGAVVLGTSPTLTTPNLGTPSSIVLTNASGTASININGTVGATTASTGAFTTITSTATTGAGLAVSSTSASSATLTGNSIYTSGGIGASSLRISGQIVSVAATGTAPLVVASTTNVANLNASSLNGATFAAPGAIGSTTASTGAFTTLSASSGINSTNIGATTRGTGAFTTLTADTTTLDDIRETVAALTYGATITPDAADGSIRTITLTGNVTFSAFTNPVSGQTITLIITQDATGSRTLTSTMKFAGGSKTLSTAANSIDILTVSYIGTTYYASLAKAFA